MINLLPPSLKQDYRYARANRRLVEWAVAFALGIIGVAIITGAGLFMMQRSIDTNQTSIAHTKAQLASENQDQVKHKVSTISHNLKLMVQVLSKEVLFSKLLARLGNVTPQGAALTDLSISQDASAIDITAKTSGYGAATQLQANLSDPSNRVFSQADLVSASCDSKSSDKNAKYPCTAHIRALLSKDSPFLFINAKKGAS
jgi:Tfp pilus assembly protein PilN